MAARDDVARYRANLQGEIDSASLYRALADAESDPQLAEVLRATRTPWSAATPGSQAAATLELASGTAVMAIGGWSSDPVPSLEEFIDAVHAGKITYYVDSGRPHGHDRNGIQIAQWVARHYRPTRIGGTTVFRLL